MGLFDRLTNRNTETLEAFLRRMLEGILKQDADSEIPGFLDVLSSLPLEQLVSTIPATVMTITEQHDQYKRQGVASADALALINTQRQALLAMISHEPCSDETAPTSSLEDFILAVVNREQQDTGPFSIDHDVVTFIVAETRSFCRMNPKHTMLAMQEKLRPQA